MGPVPFVVIVQLVQQRILGNRFWGNIGKYAKFLFHQKILKESLGESSWPQRGNDSQLTSSVPFVAHSVHFLANAGVEKLQSGTITMDFGHIHGHPQLVPQEFHLEGVPRIQTNKL